MNSHIRYLAIVSEKPEILANFYSTYFKMREKFPLEIRA